MTFPFLPGLAVLVLTAVAMPLWGGDDESAAEHQSVSQRIDSDPQIELESQAETETQTIEVEVFDQVFDNSRILEAIAVPIIQMLFGGENALEDVAVDFIGGMLGGIVEEGLDVEALLMQLRPMMASELTFVRFVCPDLNKEQRAIVRTAAEESLKRSADQLAAAHLSLDHEQVVGVLADQPPEPLKEMRQAIDDCLKSVLTEGQYGWFAEQAADRVAQRQRAAILCVVARLDGSLYLTRDQRDKIMESLKAHWKSSWEQWIRISDFDDHYLPMIADDCIAIYLDETQKPVWSELQKLDFGDTWDVDDVPTDFDNGWWGEPLHDAAGIRKILPEPEAG